MENMKCIYRCFNPCFNGSMYKNKIKFDWEVKMKKVSILVLMDLCIKTSYFSFITLFEQCFNPCFNGSMYKN